MNCFNGLNQEENRFKIAVNFVLSHEGGLTKDLRDPGGITNYGISLRFLKAAGLDINADGHIDEEDIKALRKEDAIEIYRNKWWDKYGFERIHSLNVAKKIFDLAVNMGSYWGICILQKAVNYAGYSELEMDGILGIETIAATNVCKDQYLLPSIKEYAIDHYKDIVRKHPELGIFLRGWINRANH